MLDPTVAKAVRDDGIVPTLGVLLLSKLLMLLEGMVNKSAN